MVGDEACVCGLGLEMRREATTHAVVVGTTVVVVVVVAVAVVAPAVVVVIVVVVVVGLGFKHGEQRRHGMLREREQDNETTVLCVLYTHHESRMKLTLCGERIDEIYYILCVLKCILEKVVVAPFFYFFYCEMVLI